MHLDVHKFMVSPLGILLWEVWSGGLVPYPDLNLQKAAEQVHWHLVV